MPEILSIFLFFGGAIPPGHADGMTYSKHTREICQEMLAGTLARDGRQPKCLVKLPPRPSPPMS